MELCEAQSFLQKVCSGFSFAPTYLGAAAASTDPVERFVCAIAFVVAGLHLLPTTYKPLTPLLGETFEAMLCDGAHMSCEQASQQPSVSAWMLRGPRGSYVHFGHSTPVIAGKMGNSLQCDQHGMNCIEFADRKSCIRFTQPTLRIGGIIWGERTFSYEGSAVFRDEQNHLSCELRFGGKPHDHAPRAKPSADSIYGLVQRSNALAPKTLAIVHGCWMTHMDVDNRRLWDALVDMPHVMLLPIAPPLQSDSRTRGDLVALASGDHDKSQHEKNHLELHQKRDECLRQKKSAGGGKPRKLSS